MLFIIFQITALLCFVFSIKVKMYKVNLIGFITISIVMLIVVFYHLSSSLSFLENYGKFHYLLITLLLLFISIHNTYKKYQFAREGKEL
jgi:hypothetical protein